MSGKKSSKFRSCLNACPTSGLATVRGGQRLCIFLSQLNILPKASCLLAEPISVFSVSHAAIHALERRIRQVVWWAKNYARSPPSPLSLSRGKTCYEKAIGLCAPERKRGKIGSEVSSSVVLCVRNPDKWSARPPVRPSVRPENKLHGDRRANGTVRPSEMRAAIRC